MKISNEQKVYKSQEYSAKLKDKTLSKTELDYIKELAHSGNISAAVALGEIYTLGTNEIEPNDEIAIHWLNIASEHNDPYAQYLIGSKYLYGLGVKKDEQQFITWLTKSADNGFVGAQYKLGTIYLEGSLLEQNYEKAFQYFADAAADGSLESGVEIGLMFENGRYVQKNLEEAVKYYSIAAEAGLPLAQALLGDMYYYGSGIEKSTPKAYELYRKSYIGNNDDGDVGIDLDYAIAKCYVECKIGFSKEAFSHLKKSYERGNKSAILYMCFLYNGNGSGIDEVDGKTLFNMAKESKITNDPNDQFALGFCYEFGIDTEINYKKAFELYEKAAKQGFGWGQNHLAYCYHNGLGVEQNVELALCWLLKAAETVPMAQYNLGVEYYKDQNIDESLKWFGIALDNGYTAAAEMIERLSNENEESKGQKLFEKIDNRTFSSEDFRAVKELADSGKIFYATFLGWFYLNGYKDIRQDYHLEKKYTEVAVSAGDARAKYNLAEIYLHGYGVEIDEKKATYLMLESANAGMRDAQCKMGEYYSAGKFIDQDFEKAYFWYNKAAEQKEPTSMANLGLFYEKGYFVDQNLDKAVQYYEEASELGSSFAKILLADKYLYGIGFKQDMDIAQNLYRQVAEHNTTNIDVWYQIGKNYADYALGTFREAFDCLKASHELGNQNAIIKMCFCISRCNENGGGASKDDEKILFEIANDMLHKDDPNEQFALGFCYEFGIGVEQDYKKAFEEYLKSAEQNNAYGQEKLSYFYFKGYGIEPNCEKSAYWLKKAANILPSAQFMIGIYFFTGMGVSLSKKQALKWLNRALKNGVDSAQNYIDDINKISSISFWCLRLLRKLKILKKPELKING